MAPKTPPKDWMKDGIWVDDYGWWGNALMNAVQSANVGYDPDFRTTLQDAAIKCWTAMHAAWQNSPVPGENGTTLSVIGGIANTLSPDNPPLSGRNCVTNEVFWDLSNRLFASTNDTTYVDPKTDSSLWFATANDAANKLLIDPQSGMVWERFLGAINSVPGYSWLGDQGLFIRCCLFNSRSGTDLKTPMADAIAKAVQRKCPGVLFENLFPMSSFWLDYAAGKGVFIRNIGIYNTNGPTHPDFSKWLIINADAVWSSRDQSTNQFFYYWDKEMSEPTDWGYDGNIPNTVLQASGLSALVAAIRK